MELIVIDKITKIKSCGKLETTVIYFSIFIKFVISFAFMLDNFMFRYAIADLYDRGLYDIFKQSASKMKLRMCIYLVFINAVMTSVTFVLFVNDCDYVGIFYIFIFLVTYISCSINVISSMMIVSIYEFLFNHNEQIPVLSATQMVS